MNIALVSNFHATACGVANFGRDWQAALERAGHQVTPYGWDQYPNPTQHQLVLYNWHPATICQEEDFRIPGGIPYATYLHDIPPWSTPWPPLLHGCAVYSSEPSPGTIEIPYPIYDGPLPAQIVPGRDTVIGWTGLRGDGKDALAALCATRGWGFNAPTGWLPTPQEIARLAHSTVIVLWYYASGRGQSLALATACAAGRPVLINQSEMFTLASKYPTEFYRAGVDPAVPYLEQAVDAVLDDQWKGRVRFPSQICRDHGWAQAITRMEATWPMV